MVKIQQNQYGSNWREQLINETYKDGYAKQVDGSLKEARVMGEQLRKTAEEGKIYIDKVNEYIANSISRY